MLPIRLNKKFEIRRNLPELLAAIRHFDWPKALLYVDRLEGNLDQSFFGREHNFNPGDDGEPLYHYFADRFSRIKFWVTINRSDEARYRQARRIIDELFEKITPKMPADPFEALKYVYDEIRSDWNAYWESQDPQGIQALQDDLDELRKLEPKFKACDENAYKQYREILKSTGPVSASLSSLQGRPSDKMRENMFSRVQELFSNIETLMAPEHFKFEKPEEKGGVGKPIGLDELMAGA